MSPEVNATFQRVHAPVAICAMWDVTGDADGHGGMLLEQSQNLCSRPSPALRVGHVKVICCTQGKMIHESLYFICSPVVRVHHGMCCIQGLTELAFGFVTLISPMFPVRQMHESQCCAFSGRQLYLQ